MMRRLNRYLDSARPPRHVRAAGGPGLRRAFTLVEILIALAMLVLLAGISWPVLETQITGSELPESATRFRDVLYMARAEAHKENKRVRIRFEPDAQQPVIEMEADPIEEPNVWTPVESAWAQQAMESLLLSDVQIYKIKLGRPEFTKPISINDTPEIEDDREQKQTLRKNEISALDTDDLINQLTNINPKSQMQDADYPVDENRPLLQFDAQGKVDWALITVARCAPEDELPDDEPSQWILLDGRTGLASVRDPLSEDEQTDPDNYVKRENLYMPDLTDLGQLSFKSTGFGGQPAVDADGDGVPDDPGTGGTEGSDTASDLLNNAGDLMNGGMGGNGDTASSNSDIDQKLDGSNLSQDERDNIRNALSGGGAGVRAGGNGIRGGGGQPGGGRPSAGGGQPEGGRPDGGRPGGNREGGRGRPGGSKADIKGGSRN